MKKHYNIKIYGEVQGVGFRFSTLGLAKELNLTGFVRNESDGSVYMEAEGEEKDLEKLLGWCHDGPSYGEVEKIECDKEGKVKGFDKFEIEY